MSQENFIEALRKGRAAADKAREDDRAIEEVLSEIDRALRAESSDAIALDRHEQESEVSSRTLGKFAKDAPAERLKTISLRLRRANVSPKPIGRVIRIGAGFPVVVSFASGAENLHCYDRLGFEAAMQQMLAHADAGQALVDLLAAG